MAKGMDVDAHEMYRSWVDAVESGDPFVLPHEQRGLLGKIYELAMVGAQNATAQLCMPEVRADSETSRHLGVLRIVAEEAKWYGDDAPMARAFQQARNDVASDLLPANPSEFAPHLDVDRHPSYPGHKI